MNSSDLSSLLLSLRSMRLHLFNDFSSIQGWCCNRIILQFRMLFLKEGCCILAGYWCLHWNFWVFPNMSNILRNWWRNQIYLTVITWLKGDLPLVVCNHWRTVGTCLSFMTTSFSRTCCTSSCSCRRYHCS